MAFCCQPLALRAQTAQQDSLINLLPTRTDTGRVNLLNKLSSSYWYSDTKQTFIYATQALDLAEEIHYEQGKAAASNNMGAGYYQQNQYTEALNWYEKAVASHKKTGNYRGEGFVTTNIGMIYWKRGEFPRAVEYYLKALKIWEDHGVVAETSSVYDNLGNIYNEQEQFDTALVYYQKSISIQKKYPKPATEISMTLSNTGTAYLGKGDHKNALDYFLQSLAILNPEDKESRAVSLSNVGLTYIEMKDFPQAFKYLQEALQLQSE
ncbi:MAG TPA: tetratricopeptide repeat protein, partial [Flavitalea sp.]|nr:tetratricopeptide repeat protein [Flavitalea sp.]